MEILFDYIRFERLFIFKSIYVNPSAAAATFLLKIFHQIFHDFEGLGGREIKYMK